MLRASSKNNSRESVKGPRSDHNKKNENKVKIRGEKKKPTISEGTAPHSPRPPAVRTMACSILLSMATTLAPEELRETQREAHGAR